MPDELADRSNINIALELKTNLTQTAEPEVKLGVEVKVASPNH